jgi:hypothetical protein
MIVTWRIIMRATLHQGGSPFFTISHHFSPFSPFSARFDKWRRPVLLERTRVRAPH